MKIESTLENITQAISRVQKISAKNISLPILENILCIASNNTLIIRSTNLHIGVEISVPVKVITEGEISIKLDVFSQIISSLKNEHKITLEVQNQTLYIETEKSKMNIKIYSHEDFPTLPRPEAEIDFNIPIEKLIDGVRSVAYAASVSDIKPEISSVYIYADANELVFVATDSFRLAEKRIVMNGLEEFPGVIIPIKNIQECIRVFGGLIGDIRFIVGKNQISLHNNSIYFTSRIVDGNYPDYRQIIPTESKTTALVLKEDLIQSLRLINVFSDSFNQILVKTDVQRNIIHLNSRNTDIGENTTYIEAVVKGDDIEMYLNHKYLSDSFTSFMVDTLDFNFLEKNKPFVLKGVGDDSFLYLIMPMNR